MRHRFIFWTLGLVAVLLTVSCAPAVPSTLSAATQASVPTAAVAPADATATPQAAVVDPAQPVDVQAVATSRGPNLEATDPSTVSLASGQLQLIEFFRFT